MKKNTVAYKKHLANVRKYTRAKREWQKRIKSGELSTRIDLATYRRALSKGQKLPSLEELEIVAKELKGATPTKSESLLVQKLETLLRELRASEERQRLVVSEIKRTIGNEK